MPLEESQVRRDISWPAVHQLRTRRQELLPCRADSQLVSIQPPPRQYRYTKVAAADWCRLTGVNVRRGDIRQSVLPTLVNH